MKKIMMAALFAAGLFVTTAKAQEAQKGAGRNITPEQRAQKQTEQMVTKLSLTEDQKKKVYDVMLKTVTERQQMRQSGQRPDRATMQATMKENDAQFKSILTADQYKKYEKMKEERMGQMRQRMSNDNGGNLDAAPPADGGME